MISTIEISMTESVPSEDAAEQKLHLNFRKGGKKWILF